MTNQDITTDAPCGVEKRVPCTAILSSKGSYSSFTVGDEIIRFATPTCLQRYVRVKKWDAGYIEVEADYGKSIEEDYIDLVPILEHLYYDVEAFLKPITNVVVSYE